MFGLILKPACEIDSLDYERTMVKYGSGPAPPTLNNCPMPLADFPAYYRFDYN